LKAYAYPLIGKKPINEIGVEEVLKVLKPIWYTKPTTAGNIRGRLDKIIGWATAMGFSLWRQSRFTRWTADASASCVREAEAGEKASCRCAL
jgi:hypothetical protein